MKAGDVVWMAGAGDKGALLVQSGEVEDWSPWGAVVRWPLPWGRTVVRERWLHATREAALLALAADCDEDAARYRREAQAVAEVASEYEARAIQARTALRVSAGWDANGSEVAP